MKRSLITLLTMFVLTAAHAQSVYRWVDQDGKLHYGDRPPPGQRERVTERRPSAPPAEKQVSHAMRQASQFFPVTLYVTADCGACDRGRAMLRTRGVPFAESNVASDEETNSLRTRLGAAELMLPVLQVGEKLNMGFLESAWNGLLDSAGYPQTANP